MLDIEMYVGYTNHTWDTFIISIPIDTLEYDIERTAVKIGQKALFNNPSTKDEVAFIGVYHIMPTEGD